MRVLFDSDVYIKLEHFMKKNQNLYEKLKKISDLIENEKFNIRQI